MLTHLEARRLEMGHGRALLALPPEQQPGAARGRDLGADLDAHVFRDRVAEDLADDDGGLERDLRAEEELTLELRRGDPTSARRIACGKITNRYVCAASNPTARAASR